MSPTREASPTLALEASPTLEASPKFRAFRSRTSDRESLPPVIVFGGNDNAISIVRSLGARSIPVYVLNEQRADVQCSRYARRLSLGCDLPFPEAATKFLTSSESSFLEGAVLLACSDEALEILAQHHGTLASKFRLDLSNPVAQTMMLDKLATYQAARDAEVPTPRFWQIESLADMHEYRNEFVYPLIVKPKLSHLFQRKFHSKFIVAENFGQLLDAYKVAADEKIDVLLVEKIPGPDSALCSYYTYLDEQGHALFDFTKRIVRRFPTNMGLATYHVTDHVEGVKEPALRLFRQAGLRGLANAEFKYDARDATFKLIECNARFTAANGLIVKAGLDLSSLVYNRLVGLPPPPLVQYRDGLTMWDPLRDFRAYRELSRRGELTLFGWLKSVLRPQLVPAFLWSDPRPGVVRLLRRMSKWV